MTVFGIKNLGNLVGKVSYDKFKIRKTFHTWFIPECVDYYPLRLGIAGGTESLPKEFPHMVRSILNCYRW